MSELESDGAVEVNFDGLVGPTHNYGGLSFGNVASTDHAASVSHPREAALQGLAKMKLLRDLGVKQAVLPPHPRPDLRVLRAAGFVGSDADILLNAYEQKPRFLAAVFSSSFMWTANAATVSPSGDTGDGRVHFTPANLVSKFHRSIETEHTAKLLRAIFQGEQFVHHEALPSNEEFADEGAANHFRLCETYGERGIEVFVFGRDGRSTSSKYPARQSKAALEEIVALHGLEPARTVVIQQSSAAIDAGAFHNDVVVASNQNVLLMHRDAFADCSPAVAEIQEKYTALYRKDLWIFLANRDELSLADAVKTYLFNSQIVTLPDGSMTIIAPLECEDHAGVQKYLSRVLGSGCPICSVRYLDLRQSMNNGGGPACLRLRVVLTLGQLAAVHKGVWLTDQLHDQLRSVIEKRYRLDVSPSDLAAPDFTRESLDISKEIYRVMGL